MNYPNKNLIDIKVPHVIKKIEIEYLKDNHLNKISVPVPKGKIKKNLNLPHYKPSYDSLLNINYERADFEGKWSWGIVRDWRKDSKYLKIIKYFYDNYHNKKTWREILISEKTHNNKKKHVFYEVKSINKEAQNRLIAIEMDDFEEIFRFRLQKDFRYYGFTIGNVFLSVWHDPIHKIYPSNKK